MPRRRHLLAALANPGLRRLLAVRLATQFGDGVFQASLAGAVLFNPERQASAADVAAGFAVLLLPYSVIGPFAGVLLDRWSRRRVLAATGVVRAVAVLLFAVGVASGLDGVAFYAVALVLISIGRFVLSALGAALPHVVAPDELVTANSLSTTAGTIITAVGGAVAVAVRGLIGSDDRDYAVIAATAALPYLLAATAAVGFAVAALGPSATERAGRETAGDVLRGLSAGLRHLGERRAVRDGLLAITAHRLAYGVTTVCTVLLYRNHFTTDGVFRAGLAGLAQVVAMIAIGGGLAALVTPVAFRRLGPVGWITACLVAAAVVQLGLVQLYRLPTTLLAALLLGFVAQSIKITVDTLLQQQIDDDYRGRVFALYDMLFNATLVAAATLTATVLPEDGYSRTSVLVIAAAYLATAITYGRAARVSSAPSTSR